MSMDRLRVMMATTPNARLVLNKVPEVTVYFWLIKVLATTVGETAADFLDTSLNLGLTVTSYIMSAGLMVALACQFRSCRYRAPAYWVSVVMISIVGTLITDNLSDNYNVPLELTTAVFSVALAVTFAAWYAAERTLSIHTIVTRRREAFYWLAVLFTFALGTAAGDLVAEKSGVGYGASLFLFGAAIVAVCAARFGLKLNSVACFWVAYILTRPLGASLGDLLSQPQNAGGLGFGTTATSFAFLAAILALVAYLSVSKADVSPEVEVA
jgi:uncharacterized membrane-anchored protein